jgi:hypothetical protein
MARKKRGNKNIKKSFRKDCFELIYQGKDRLGRKIYHVLSPWNLFDFSPRPRGKALSPLMAQPMNCF